MRKLIALLVFLFGVLGTQAQVGNLPLNEYYDQFYIDSLLANTKLHSALRPLRADQLPAAQVAIDALGRRVDSRWAHWLFNKEWASVQAGKRTVALRPIVALELGPLFTQSLGGNSQREGLVQELQLGLNAVADLTPRLTADLSVAFVNWSPSQGWLAWLDSTETIPRWGRVKNKDDYSAAAFNWWGELSYKPSDYFHLQVGRGKHFVGHGYRSLLLSDWAPAYNYVRATVQFGGFQYVYLLGQHIDLNPYTPAKYSTKYTATHVASLHLTRWWNLYFFETIVQQATDAYGRVGLDPNYLNPVAFFRPVEFNLGSPDNALLGLGGQLRFSPRWQLYGQAVIDEFILAEMTTNRGFWGNKYGLQAGLRTQPWRRLRGLWLQAEWNLVRPYTYSHGPTAKVYGSMHHPLAHPMGANFSELLAIVRYNTGRLTTSLKWSYARQGTDLPNTNYGADIYKDYDTRTVPDDTRVVVPGWGENDFGHQLLQGALRSTSQTELRLVYLLNPKNRLAFETGFVRRTQRSDNQQTDYNYGFLGLRCLLYDYRTDF